VSGQPPPPADATRQETAAAQRPGPLDDLPLLISRLHHNVLALVGRALAEHGLDRQGLRPGMGMVLYALFENDDQIISRLAERAKLANSTVTGLLDQMEKAELITRNRDPRDGRAVRVRLTDRGRGLEQPCTAMHRELVETLQASLDPRQARDVREALALMIDSVRGPANGTK